MSTHVTLVPVALPAEADDVVAFLLAHTFPFHVATALTEPEARRRVAETYPDEDHEPLWVVHPEHGRVGLAVLEDLTDGGPMFDLRLAEEHRGHGYGAAALRELATWTFTRHPEVHRLEGNTRSDNVAMRRTFAAAGLVQEAQYRQAWPAAGGTLLDAVAYAVLRPDWESGTTTAPLASESVEPASVAPGSVAPRAATGTPHHIELWVPDLARARTSWGGLLGALGYGVCQEWPDGTSWLLGSTYVVVEQSPALSAAEHDRLRPGLNHLAFHVASRPELDAVVKAALASGWRHLYPERHPDDAGVEYDEGYYAAYLIDSDGFEVELVAP